MLRRTPQRPSPATPNGNGAGPPESIRRADDVASRSESRAGDDATRIRHDPPRDNASGSVDQVLRTVLSHSLQGPSGQARARAALRPRAAGRGLRLRESLQPELRATAPGRVHAAARARATQMGGMPFELRALPACGGTPECFIRTRKPAKSRSLGFAVLPARAGTWTFKHTRGRAGSIDPDRRPVFHGARQNFSRFLYLLPPTFVSAVVADNGDTNGELCAEICADANFNPNLHPATLPWEIRYPTTEGEGREGQLLCADIDVTRDPEDPNGLRLMYRPTGARINPYDLGFLNPLRRPPLYRLLSDFTPIAAFSIPLPQVPEPPDTRLTDRPSRVVCRPRITYEHQVVLARRRWTVPFDGMPLRLPTDSETEYFVRVFKWRRETAFPLRCS